MLFGCDQNNTVDTNKNIYEDDISDITFLYDSFFTTNYDLSFNSSSQIDLIKFKTDNNQEVYMDNHFDLGLNGQGYLAITNDGEELYLQSRKTSLLFKYSTIGQQAFYSLDNIDYNWQPSGITYLSETDSLMVLYRSSEDNSQFKARRLSKDFLFNDYEISFMYDFISHDIDKGIYAIENKNLNFYILGVDTSSIDILITTNQFFEVITLDTIPNSNVVGLCIKNDQLFLSYRDKRIQKWKDLIDLE